MNNIFEYWMNISKEVSKKTKNYKGEMWDWENHKNDIKTLKNKFKNKYLTILGKKINLNTGDSEDLILPNENDTNNYTIYLFHYSKAKDVGTSNNWVKYYDLMEGLSKGVIPFQNSIEKIKKLLDTNQDKAIQIIELLGGNKTTYGDLSYIICPLPNIQILFIYHQGDEEFQSQLNVLFDKNVLYYQPPELIWGLVAAIGNRITFISKF